MNLRIILAATILNIAFIFPNLVLAAANPVPTEPTLPLASPQPQSTTNPQASPAPTSSTPPNSTPAPTQTDPASPDPSSPPSSPQPSSTPAPTAPPASVTQPVLPPAVLGITTPSNPDQNPPQSNTPAQNSNQTPAAPTPVPVPVDIPFVLPLENQPVPEATPFPTHQSKTSHSQDTKKAVPAKKNDTPVYHNLVVPALSFITRTNAADYYKSDSLPENATIMLLSMGMLFIFSGIYLLKSDLLPQFFKEGDSLNYAGR